MTRRILVLATARRDIDRALRISRTEFGPEARLAYRTLIGRALVDLAVDPVRPGVRGLSDVRIGIFGYHLRFSKAGIAGRQVRRPRHVVLFRISDDALIVARLLHERMLPSRHL